MAEQFVIYGDFLTMSAEDFGGEDWSLVSDPPYSPHVHAGATSCGTGAGSQIRNANGMVGVRHRDLGFDPLTAADRAHLGAVAARCTWSVIFSDIEGGALWREVLPRYIRTIPWVRWSSPQLSGDRPPQGAEYVLVQSPPPDEIIWYDDPADCLEVVLGYRVGGRMYYNGPGNLTHFDETALRGADKHKCEKPLDLCCRLVEYFSKPGDTILDPYAGSGAIGVACRELGRNYVGIERDEEWAARANARLLAPLSERDQGRFQRYLDRKAEIDHGNVKRAAATAKTRQAKVAARAASDAAAENDHRNAETEAAQ
jgi:hypothetical protein